MIAVASLTHLTGLWLTTHMLIEVIDFSL